MLILDFLFVTLLFLAVAAGIFYLCESFAFRSGRAGRVVYMGSDLKFQSEALKKAVDEFVGSEARSYALVEPGAGIGHVSRFLLKAYPWKSATAIELRPTVFWLGKLFAWRRFAQLKYLRQDLFSYAYAPPSVIYCYLTSPIISRLYREGVFEGSVVICLTFAIEGVQAAKEYPLRGWQRVLRVYDFR